MLDRVTGQIAFYQDRLLEDGNATDALEDTDDENVGEEEARGMGFIFLAAFIVVVLFVAWRSFKIWQARRERYNLQVQSARADTVLGDMQVSGLFDPTVEKYMCYSCFFLCVRWFQVRMSTVTMILNCYSSKLPTL